MIPFMGETVCCVLALFLFPCSLLLILIQALILLLSTLERIDFPTVCNLFDS